VSPFLTQNSHIYLPLCFKIIEIMEIEVNMKKIVVSDKAPKAIGPYSVAVQTGQMVYTAGQIGLDPATGEIVPGGIEAETRQVLTNLKNVLEASGSSLGDVVKTTVFLRDMADFAKMNAIYGEFFNQQPPARSTIAVAGLPKGGAVEIEAVATLREHA
jgi:2-iminobutanoate/2-iminopropanoate deaminase